jgi:hypothetical protein
MKQDGTALVEAKGPESDSRAGVHRVHPLLAAIERAPLEPISDEENALLDEILHRADYWVKHEDLIPASRR